MDGDGKLDLFLADQSGAADAMFRNDGTTFVDVAPRLGMTGPPRTKDEGGVGCAVGDYDNDGRLDLFVANYGRNQLYHNNGDGTFTDMAKQLGVDVENHAVSADWGDYDNDGYLDLMVICVRRAGRPAAAGERALPQRRRQAFRQRADEGQSAQRQPTTACNGLITTTMADWI